MTHKTRMHLIAIIFMVSAMYAVAITAVPQLAHDAAAGYIVIVLAVIAIEHRGRG